MTGILLIIGALLPLVSGVVYVASILRGKTRPQRMTRFLMVAVTGISTAALWMGDDRTGFWLALTSLLEALLIWFLCFGKRGVGGRDRLDLICLVLCAVGCALWLVSGESLVGLLTSIAVDVIACTPALVKTVRLPHTESFWFYVLGVLAGLCVFLAGPMTWRAALFPLYIMLIDGAFALVIAFGRRRVGLDVPATPMG